MAVGWEVLHNGCSRLVVPGLRQRVLELWDRLSRHLGRLRAFLGSSGPPPLRGTQVGHLLVDVLFHWAPPVMSSYA